MEGDGIWNACTMNVITNPAIPTVPSSDCNEPLTPVPTAQGVLRSPGERSPEDRSSGRRSAEGSSAPASAETGSLETGSLNTGSLDKCSSGKFIGTSLH